MAEAKLWNKVAIVTGASRGMGAGVAREFAAEGAAVALFDVLDDAGKLAAEAIAARGGRALYLHCDVSCEDEVVASIEQVVSRFGGLDVLYNNAAVQLGFGRRVADLPVEHWDRTLAVNLRGPFLCAKYALPHLVRRGGGSILNVSSHGAFRAYPSGVADYAVTKGALVTLTHYLAAEYGAENVRANCLVPGPIPTELVAKFMGTEEGRRQTVQIVPLGRLGEIGDMARAAVFLASDDARWISGAVLPVDGGTVNA